MEAHNTNTNTNTNTRDPKPPMRRTHTSLIIAVLGLSTVLVSSFTQGLIHFQHKRSLLEVPPLFAGKETNVNHSEKVTIGQKENRNLLKTVSLASFILGSVFFQSIAPVGADEYGRETEAPTFFTGENVMICTKRGPLGACLETTVRTSANDNDKATKYFGDPAAALKERYRVAQLQQLDNNNDSELTDESEGNQLLKRLKQQSIENKDKNDKAVRQKTLQNDLGASFGPFDTQVVVMNSDGDSYTILSGPQATRLKQQGYLKGRRFVTQPSQEVIDAAAATKEGDGFIGGLVKGIFGGSSSSNEDIIN